MEEVLLELKKHAMALLFLVVLSLGALVFAYSHEDGHIVFENDLYKVSNFEGVVNVDPGDGMSPSGPPSIPQPTTPPPSN